MLDLPHDDFSVDIRRYCREPQQRRAVTHTRVGLQSCEKLRPDLKPDAGLNHMPNALLFYWFQGYLSAANIYLLKEHMDYVDIGAVDAATITQIVAEFCEKNPQAKPITALDKFIRDAKKIKAKRSDAFNPWNH